MDGAGATRPRYHPAELQGSFLSPLAFFKVDYGAALSNKM